MQSTLQGRKGLNAYRKTAITIGVIYLAGMVVGIGGNILIQSVLGAPDHLATLRRTARWWPLARYCGCLPSLAMLHTAS